MLLSQTSLSLWSMDSPTLPCPFSADFSTEVPSMVHIVGHCGSFFLGEVWLFIKSSAVFLPQSPAHSDWSKAWTHKSWQISWYPFHALKNKTILSSGAYRLILSLPMFHTMDTVRDKNKNKSPGRARAYLHWVSCSSS